MKRTCICLLAALICQFGNLTAQTNPIITRDIIICYAHEPVTTNTYTLLLAVATANNVTVQKIDSLYCIPNTFWIQLRGHQTDVLAVVNGIKRTPPQDTPTDPVEQLNQLNQLNQLETPHSTRPEPRRTDTIALFNNSCLTPRTGDSKPVIVALIDGGIEAVGASLANSHTLYFAPYLWHHPVSKEIGYDFTQTNSKVYPVDSAGHGTNMAGLMVDMFKRFNVNNTRLMILKTQNRFGVGQLWDVFRAFDKAVCNNANIINLSLSGAAVRDTANKGALNNLIQWLGVNKNILVVAAAGNNNVNVATSDKMYYAGSFVQPNLINVAALSPTGDSLWAASNYGPTVDIAAPGVNIPCLQPFALPVVKSGTSISTAYVTAAAAILAANRPSQTFEFASIKTAIIMGAMKPLLGNRPIASQAWLNTCGALTYFKAHPSGVQSLVSGTVATNGNTLNANPLSVYPNPFTDVLTLSFALDAPQRVELRAFNVVGQQVWARSMTGVAGLNQVDCPMLNAAQGLFTFVVKTAETQWIQKAVKQ